MSNERGSTTERGGFRGRHMIYALLGGAAAGAIAALVTAPESGAALRYRLRSSASQRFGEVRELPDALEAAYDAARGAFTEALRESAAAEAKLTAGKRDHEPSHRHAKS